MGYTLYVGWLIRHKGLVHMTIEEYKEMYREIERLRAALQLIAADITGNKHHQAQFRQDTARAALREMTEIL
jgi:hypothetical protein